MITIDYTNTIIAENNDIIANNTEDKLNIIGAFFANINNDIKSDNAKFTEVINNKARAFLDLNCNDTLLIQRLQLCRQPVLDQRYTIVLY